MKVLLINGSPHKEGCTFTALNEVAKTLEKNGIETEILSGQDVQLNTELMEALKYYDSVTNRRITFEYLMLKDVNDSTSQVQVTSKEMANGIENVVIAKNNLDAIAQTVANSMDEISSGVSEINGSAQDVSVMANTTSDNIQIMKSIIDTFKLE